MPHKRRICGPGLFVLPSLAGVSIFVFLPFADVVRRSFASAAGKEFTGLHNYKVVLENKAFRLAVGNTGKFLLVCVPLLLAVSLLLAVIVHFGGMKFYRNVCLLPMAVPVVSLTFVWNMVFHRNGLLNSYGNSSIDWLNSSHAFGVLAASFLWKNTGYYVVLWLAGLEKIPKELYEAAAVDGAGFWRKFCSITLPGLKPVFSAAFVLAITGTLKSYRESYLLAGEYPDKSIYMVQHLFHNWFRDMSMEKMAAGAVMLVCIFAVIVYPFRKKGGGNLDSLSG
ncbi:MAG: sugar ABC transporter permease [Lachnospiraceae bacterium]|nr:sugar ABC transporter permease [Lachnospiraceae bacterium]